MLDFWSLILVATRVAYFHLCSFEDIFCSQTHLCGCFSVQDIIQKYIRTSGKGNKHATLASTSGELTWEKPIYSDFQVLSRYLL